MTVSHTNTYTVKTRSSCEFDPLCCRSCELASFVKEDTLKMREGARSTSKDVPVKEKQPIPTDLQHVKAAREATAKASYTP